MRDTNSGGIALIGLTGRFPGAANVEEFWRNLAAGVESITTFTDEELTAAGLDVAALRKTPGYVAARGILKDAEWFDAGFFGINPKEAEATDPQQRLFLEAAWEALENAGYDPERFPGLIGVYAGMGNGTYYLNNLHSRPDVIESVGWLAASMGNEKDFLATRVAYKLNLKGPAISINTACSTSLVAVCQACQSLLNYQCDVALAGGVSVSFPQQRGYHYQEGGITSPDGHCRAFDAQALGTVSSDGLGIVVLKRMAEAVRDGDRIHAVIKGFAVNNDGSGKVSFTSPSVDGQAEAIALAQAQAGFDPATITCVEAHGTGTPLGDPIEIAGLTQAFGATAAKNFCAIGSVKTNIGHLDTAAGVAGLIKTALALEHRLVPPSLHFTVPNPQIDFAHSPFYVNAALAEWKAGPTPRRAGVSSFGLGGTNAHVVLEEAPMAEPSGVSRGWQLLLLSAKSASALDKATANLAAYFKANPGVNLADVAFTLQTGRGIFNHRRMLVCRDVPDAVQALEVLDPKRVTTERHETKETPVVFMFPGQGTQYVNMGAELYQVEPVFKQEVDECAEILRSHLGLDLREVLFPSVERVKTAEELLIQTRITQPALFVIEYALARLWMSWGVKPRAMIGHSVGEYVAGCLAGVFMLREALGLVAGRARLVQAQPDGAMLAVRLPEAEVRPLLRNGLSIAAVNSPTVCVVAGPYEAIDHLEKQLGERGVAGRRLQTSHAFHSAMMDPVIAPFTELLKKASLKAPGIPYISNVTAQWITGTEATNPDYWAGHVRQTVRFADGLAELLKDGRCVLLEVGPGQTLGTMARQHPAKTLDQAVVSSLSAAKEQESHGVLNALGKLWLAGVAVDWAGFYQHEKRQRLALPTYPFERKRYWVEPGLPPARVTVNAPSPGGLETHLPGGNGARTFQVGRESADLSIRQGERIMLTEGRNGAADTPDSRKDDILRRLTQQLQELSGISLAELDPSATFPELGFDSLFLAQASQAFQKMFGVKITFRQLLDELPTLNDLANHLDQTLPREFLTTGMARPSSAPPPAGAADAGAKSWDSHLEALEKQLEMAARQLETLRQICPAAMAPPARNGGETAEAVTLPLTDAQMELWLATRLGEDASRALNQIVSIRLRGLMDEEQLRKSLLELMLRHDALRTAFLPDGSGQRISPVAELDFARLDFSALAPAGREEKLASVTRQEDGKAFDLANGPLFRALLIKLSTTEHALLLATHHLVVDGWSVGVMLDELGRLYSAGIQGVPAGLQPAMQYGDYLKWQKAPENQPEFARAEAHWLNQFANPPSPVELPADHVRPSSKTFRAVQQSLVLETPFCEALRQAVARAGCTLFGWLLASFKVWLCRLSGQEDLTVGIPAAGQMMLESRPEQEVRALIGHCVNLLPLRSQNDGELSFKDHAKAVKRVVLDAYEHQNFTFGSLVKKLNLPRDSSRLPLVSNTFNVTRAFSGFHWHGLEVEADLAPKGFNIFDLSVDVTDFDQELRIVCRYNSDLFEAATVQSWLSHWKTLLEGMATYPEQRVSTLSMLTETERHHVLEGLNRTEVSYPRNRCLHELIEDQVRRAPEAVAVRFEGQLLTYRQLNERANQLARHLQGLGVGPDTLVGICVERSLEMVVGLLGILKAGGAYVPLDPEYPAERLAFMLADAGAPVLLTQARLAASLPTHQARVLRLDEDRPLIARESAGDVKSPVAAEHLAYMIYTSGSTGRPKGAMNTHAAIVNRLLWMQDAYRLIPSDRVLQKTPFSFDVSVWEFFWPLLAGATLVVAQPGGHKDSAYLAQLIDREKITTLHFVPSMLGVFLEQAGLESTCAGLKRVICSGEALPFELQEKFFARLPAELHNLYGPTEAAVDVTCWACERGSRLRTVPIGRPIANTRIHILDRHLQPVPMGVPGELHIGGIGLARGYHNRPELTAEKFIADPFRSEPEARLYKTGDLARYLPDGAIEYLGRLDHQVKIRGFRIELGEIEAVLRGHPQVGEIVLMARAGAAGDKQLAAYVVARENPAPSPRELRAFLKEKLPDYMVPGAFVFLEHLPLTPNGKVDRKALPEPDVQTGTREIVPPRTPAEQAVAGIWREVLGLKEVGIHENFFELGGHSLIATQLISRLERFHGVQASLRDVFDSSTVAAMAEWLDKKAVQPAAAEVPPLVPLGRGPGRLRTPP